MISRTTILETPRFQLRIPNETDIDFVFSASRYPGFNDGMQWEAPTEKAPLWGSLERCLKRWGTGEEYAFTVVDKLKPDHQLGRISIRPEEEPAVWSVGFWVHPEAQGKGVMTESLAPVLTFGFERLGAQKIIASYATWNKGSEKVLTRNGLRFSRYLEQGLLKKGEWVPENEVMITKATWKGGVTSE